MADDLLTKPIVMHENVDTPLTREALYALAWSEPMLKVAARFGVSSSYMARVCTRMNVPRPALGYWAKLAVSKAQKPPPLPEARPWDELVWSRDGDNVHVTKPLPKPPRAVHRRPAATAPRPDQHPLIRGAKPLFEVGRLSYEGGYLKPAKHLLPDLTVTKSGLDKAISFANQLFLTLEESGHRVVIAPYGEHFHREAVDEREKPDKGHHYNNLWSPGRPTVVYIGTVAIGLTIIEMSEDVEARYVNGEYVRISDYVPPKRGRYAVDHGWTTKKAFPTGRLCLQAYSPYSRAKWVNHWRETEDRDLISQIKGIVRELERAVIAIAQRVEEGRRQAEIEHRQWEAQQEKWRQEEKVRRAAEARKESQEELLEIIESWAESNRIEQFFKDAERQSANLKDADKARMLERLKLARELIGNVDAIDHFLAWKSPDER
jgi:hypothetical protein